MLEHDLPHERPVLPWDDVRNEAKNATRRQWPLVLGVPLGLALVAGVVQWWIGGGDEKAWDDVTGSAFLASLITLAIAIVLVVIVQMLLAPLTLARREISDARRLARGLVAERDAARQGAANARAERDGARRDLEAVLRELEEARHDLADARTRAVPTYANQLIRDQDVFLPDLVREGDPVVRRKTFVDCTLRGPAEVAFLPPSLELVSCSWQGVHASALIRVVPNDTMLFGVIGFEACAMHHCDWENVTIVAPAAMEQALRAGIAAAPQGPPGRREERAAGRRPEDDEEQGRDG